MLASGRAIGAMADRQPTAAAASPSTPATMAPASAHAPLPFGHGASCGGAAAVAAADTGAPGAGNGFSAARTTSGVNGGWRKRTPVASKMALAIAAVPGTDADSPAPSGGSPGRGQSITPIHRTPRKVGDG